MHAIIYITAASSPKPTSSWQENSSCWSIWVCALRRVVTKPIHADKNISIYYTYLYEQYCVLFTTVPCHNGGTINMYQAYWFGCVTLICLGLTAKVIPMGRTAKGNTQG